MGPPAHEETKEGEFMNIKAEEAMTLYVAAIVGVAALALELRRLGLSEDGDELSDAKDLRTLILAEAEKSR